jgi:uncharacterized membrane protein
MSKKGIPNRIGSIVAGLFVLALCAMAGSVRAADDIVVSPGVFDETGGVRQTIDRQVKIRNNSAAKVELYVVISDLGSPNGAKTTLSNWLEISRGVISLKPAEEKTLPLKIVVGANAVPGQYHAQMIFAKGGNRWDAEASSKNSIQPKVIVNYSLEEKIIDKLNNAYFKTAKPINTDKKVNFLYSIKNVGNVEQKPSGTISIFNRQGAEVAALPVNGDGLSLDQNAQRDFVTVWQAGNRVGKYKAKIEITYGSDNSKSVGDTLYFWVLPRWLLYLLVSILGFLAIALAYLFFKIRKPGAYVGHTGYHHTIDLKGRTKR